jgi:hypothetical protein
MGRTYLFMGGNSHPRDQHLEILLRTRLAGPGDRFIGQQDLLDQHDDGQWRVAFRHRRELLRCALDGLRGQPGPVVLLGRSSGAWVQTALAAEPGWHGRIGALLCFGYPFRHPRCAVERRRFLHLFRLAVPTLILQGRHDPYGGAEVADQYLLSEAVGLRVLETDHALRMPPEAWDGALEDIRHFLSTRLGPAGP